MNHVVFVLSAMLFGLLSCSALAVSEELKLLFEKTASSIESLDTQPFSQGQSRAAVPFDDPCGDRLDCRRTLLRQQIYTGDIEGAERSLAIIQKEVDSLAENSRQNKFRVFIADSLSRLRRYRDAVAEAEKINEPIFRVQAILAIADLFFDDKEGTGIEIEPLLDSALAVAVEKQLPDRETLLIALEGLALARAKKTSEAQARFQQAYDAVARAVRLVGPKDASSRKKRSRPDVDPAIDVDFPSHNPALVEKRLLQEIIRYQTIAGLWDDAFEVYKNHVFLSESLKTNSWERFALLDMIIRTLAEQGEIEKAVEIVKRDKKMEDASAPSMLIALALSKEGKIKEMFNLLDLPQFKEPQATGGILNVVLGTDHPDVAGEMRKRFPELGYDKMLRARACFKLVEEGKWNEAITAIKALDNRGSDDYMSVTTRNGVLRSVAYSEWQKGNFEHSREAIKLLRISGYEKRLEELQRQYEKSLKIADPEERSRALREVSYQQSDLLDFDGKLKTALAILDATAEIEWGDPRSRLTNGIAMSLFTEVRAQQLDAKRSDGILEKGWKMMLAVDGVFHLDRIEAMLHNNGNRRALFKVAEFAAQGDSVVEQVQALLTVAKEIATIEMEYQPISRDKNHY